MKKKEAVRGSVKAFAALLILGCAYLNFEPTITAAAGDTNVVVTQVVASEISISKSGDVSMSPNISGMTGGTATGSTTLTVITNNATGFSLALKASTSPALQSGSYSFADYTESTGGTPDYSWGIASTDSEFGYTVEPATLADNIQAFKDNGTACGGTGTAQAADKCWANFTTSDSTVINRGNTTSQAGEAEVIKFEAQSGSGHFQNQATYTATITATATIN
jgi:hypothetical protein